MATIRIINFDQYNPRKDRSRHYWFKVENSIIYSESLDELEADQKWFWIFLLAYAKEKQCDTFELKMKYFVKHSGVSEKKILAALEILNQNKSIELLPDDSFNLETNGNQMSPNGCLDKRREEKNTEEDISSAEPAAAVFGPDELLKVWNENRGTLPKAEKLTDKRRKHAYQRLKEKPEAEYWIAVVTRIRDSDFCNNRSAGSQGWHASFDFLLQPDTHVKVTEGKYDRVHSQPKLAARVLPGAVW